MSAFAGLVCFSICYMHACMHRRSCDLGGLLPRRFFLHRWSILASFPLSTVSPRGFQRVPCRAVPAALEGEVRFCGQISTGARFVLRQSFSSIFRRALQRELRLGKKFSGVFRVLHCLLHPVYSGFSSLVGNHSFCRKKGSWLAFECS